MRILLISHTCQSRGEGQRRAEILARIPGIELLVLSPNRWRHYGRWRGPDTPAKDALFHYSVGRVCWPWAGPAQCYLHWYPEMARLVKEFRPDIIDLWEEPWGLVSAQAVSIRNRFAPEAKIVSETEQNINKRLPPPFERFRSFTLRHADFVVARNSEALEVARSHGYRGPCEVVPNAVDETLFQPMDRSACRSSLGVSGFVAGYVGRMVEEKGLADLIDALASCERDLNLVCVGNGPYEKQLEDRGRELRVLERIRFLPAKPREELPSLMNALDVLVLPSRTTPSWKEQFGRVVIEAHACGVPVIGTNSGAIPEVIGAGGLIVPERNPAALASALSRLTRDPRLCQKLGRAGREQALALYTWERVAGQFAAIYERLLEPVPKRVLSATG